MKKLLNKILILIPVLSANALGHSQTVSFVDGIIEIEYFENINDSTNYIQKVCTLWNVQFEKCPEGSNCYGKIAIYESENSDEVKTDKYINLKRAYDILEFYTQHYGDHEIYIEFIGTSISSKFRFGDRSALDLGVVIR